MQNSRDLVSADPAPKAPPLTVPTKIGNKRLLTMAAVAVVLALCFAAPLWEWICFSMDSEFYSYTPLMPVITGYLIWIKRRELSGIFRPGWVGAVLSVVAAAAVLGVYFHAKNTGWFPEDADYLCAMLLSFLLLLLAAAFVILGRTTVAAISFPLAMLIFMAPYPEAVKSGIESFLQHTSASTVYGFFTVVGTPCVKDDLVLHLRGPTQFSDHEITNAAALVQKWKSQSDPVSALLWSQLPAGDQKALSNYQPSASTESVQGILLRSLNQAEVGPSLYTPARFNGVDLREETTSLVQDNPSGANLAIANRLLLEDAYRHELSPMDFGLEVAPECSGIHSTQVLFITSLLAGYLFLTSPWRRGLLALLVIPLAIARNAFRILVIGELCIHVNHKMIDSWIHVRGGPVFFALSLIPFFLLLIWLRKSESKRRKPVQS